MRSSLTIAATAILALAASAWAQDKPLYLDPKQPIEARVEDLLARMTPEEKVQLCYGSGKFATAAIPRLGIPERWLSDGPHGVRAEVMHDTWDDAGWTNDFITAMPCAMSLASTFNPDLAKTYGETVAEEARVRSKDIMLGPAINIQRSPLGGRSFEYMGEDPWLTSRIAVGYINGMQSRDVAACIKHFALNNQETQRNSIDVQVDERALREIYLPAFHAAVKEANVLTFMGAYNKVRGQWCCENELLLNTILKGEWGFKGLVMTDWGGAHSTDGSVLNGLDLEMGTNKPYNEYFLADAFLAGVKSGKYSMSLLDDKARRNLRVMFASKVFEPQDRYVGSMNTKAHQATARKVAEQGTVLLKNDRAILPLDPAKVRSIAVIGDFATRIQTTGGGSAGLKPLYEITPLEGIVRRVGDKANVSFSQGFRLPPPPPRRNRSATSRSTTGVATTAPTSRDVAGVRRDFGPTTAPADPALWDRAVEAAKNADVAIIVGGLGHGFFYDTEGADRRDMKLPFYQDELIRRVVAANPNTIVILESGAAVDMTAWVDQVPGVVQLWYPGVEGGNALAGLLFGDVNPSGKLPCTFPRVLADSPAHTPQPDGSTIAWPGKDGVEEYREGILVGYRWFDTKKVEPLFPFGHGLSYTTFALANPKVTANSDGSLKVTCDLTNTGKRAGAQVVQVYVHDVQCSLPRPEKELKGFARVEVDPGDTRPVTITLPPNALAYYDPDKKSWISEAGDFDLLIGTSSRDTPLKATYHLAETRLEK